MPLVGDYDPPSPAFQGPETGVTVTVDSPLPLTGPYAACGPTEACGMTSLGMTMVKDEGYHDHEYYGGYEAGLELSGQDTALGSQFQGLYQVRVAFQRAPG